jgi:hypothetical protein
MSTRNASEVLHAILRKEDTLNPSNSLSTWITVVFEIRLENNSGSALVFAAS